jgi:hypothetical protein
VSETARDLVTLLYGHATAHALKDLPSISFCSRARKCFPYGETRTSVKMLENLYGHTSNRAMASKLTKMRSKERKKLTWEQPKYRLKE